jgi:hypothetical protein
MPEAAFTCPVTWCWRMRWVDDTGADVVISVGGQRPDPTVARGTFPYERASCGSPSMAVVLRRVLIEDRGTDA